MIFNFVDISGIADHHCLKTLFIRDGYKCGQMYVN